MTIDFKKSLAFKILKKTYKKRHKVRVFELMQNQTHLDLASEISSIDIKNLPQIPYSISNDK